MNQQEESEKLRREFEKVQMSEAIQLDESEKLLDQAEIDEILRITGHDPEKVGRRIAQVTRDALSNMINSEDQSYGDYLRNELVTLIETFKDAKPEERGEKARCYAVTITELEKALAYFTMYVVNGE